MKLRRRIKVHRLSPLWKPKLLDPEGPCDHEKMRRQSQWRTYEIEMKATFNKNQRQYLADLPKLDQEVMQLHAQNQEAASHMKQLYLRGPASMGDAWDALIMGAEREEKPATQPRDGDPPAAQYHWRLGLLRSAAMESGQGATPAPEPSASGMPKACPWRPRLETLFRPDRHRFPPMRQQRRLGRMLSGNSYIATASWPTATQQAERSDDCTATKASTQGADPGEIGGQAFGRLLTARRQACH